MKNNIMIATEFMMRRIGRNAFEMHDFQTERVHEILLEPFQLFDGILFFLSSSSSLILSG